MYPSAEMHTLKRVQVGLICTVVESDNLCTGVAYTLPRAEHCRISDLPKPLAGRKASDLVAFLAQRDLVLSSPALATINALLFHKSIPTRSRNRGCH